MTEILANVQDTEKSYYSPRAEGLLAPLRPFLDDKTVSEIVLNRPQEIFVEKQGKFTCHDVPSFTESKLSMLFQLVANENRQLLSPQMPLLSGSLQDGSRVQLVLPPVAKHYTFAVRRQTVQRLTLEDYGAQKFYQNAKKFDLQTAVFSHLPQEEQELINLYQKNEWHKFIKFAVYLKKNIVISGGTSSGKTTFLNACLREIPLDERIITLEDTREIDALHPNQVNLLASKGEQGTAKIDMQGLVQCCLRLRPDRIIMGEIRGREILDFLGACSTGHEGSITSVHANNPRVAFMRMTQMYKQNNVPSMSDADIMRELHEVIDVVVQVVKTANGREVQSIYYKHGELMPC